MFERFTESARRAMFFARYEASQLGGLSIETEHLLLGVLREAKGLTGRILNLSQVSLDKIRNDIEGRPEPREKLSTSVEMPLSVESQSALQFAAEEADRLRHGYIGTEHLLLGLLREETSVAASTLMAHGLRLDGVRTEIVKLLGESPALSTQAAELFEQVEEIKRLVEDLSRTSPDSSEARELVDTISRHLDALKRDLAD